MANLMIVMLLPFIYCSVGILIIVILIKGIQNLINKGSGKPVTKISQTLKIPLLIIGGIMVLLIFLVSGKGKIIQPIVNLIPIIVVLVGMSIFIREYKGRKAKGTDSTIYAEITKVKDESYMEKNQDTGKQYRKNQYSIEYKYDINGVTYTGYGYSYYGKNVGQNIKIYYNSKQPQESELAEKRTINIIGIIAMIIIFLLVLPVIIAMFKG